MADFISTTGYFYLENEEDLIQIYGQLMSGVVASYAGYDVNVATQSAKKELKVMHLNDAGVYL